MPAGWQVTTPFVYTQDRRSGFSLQSLTQPFAKTYAQPVSSIYLLSLGHANIKIEARIKKYNYNINT